MAETTNARKPTPEPNPTPTPKDNPKPDATTTTTATATRARAHAREPKPKPKPKPKPRATKRADIDEREALRRRANNERIRRSRMRKVESEIASGVRGRDGKVKRSTERPWW